MIADDNKVPAEQGIRHPWPGWQWRGGHEALQRAGGNSRKSLLGLNTLFKHISRAAKGGFRVRMVPDG